MYRVWYKLSWKMGQLWLVSTKVTAHTDHLAFKVYQIILKFTWISIFYNDYGYIKRNGCSDMHVYMHD